MSEPIEFKYVNDSLTTLPQAKLISKIASYIKVPVKKLRACIDEERIKTGVVSFPKLNCNFDAFSVSGIKLNVKSILSHKAFCKSDLLALYTISNSSKNTNGLPIVLNPDFPMVMWDSKQFTFKNRGVGGLYVSYPDTLVVDQVILPLEIFLTLRYPSPQTINWLNEV